MSEHPNVTVINRMTEAAVTGDKKALAECFTEDMAFHVRPTRAWSSGQRPTTTVPNTPTLPERRAVPSGWLSSF